MAKDKDDKTKVINASLLSDAEKEIIAAEVAQQIEDEAKEKATEKYRKELLLAAKKKELMKDAKPGDPDENGLVPVFVDLPRVSECIRLDGVAFYPGRTYNVLPEVKAVILECMARGREHEDSLNGKTAKENIHRRTGQTIAH